MKTRWDDVITTSNSMTSIVNTASDYSGHSNIFSNNIANVSKCLMKNVDEIMDSFVHKGIISGWEMGDYV